MSSQSTLLEARRRRIRGWGSRRQLTPYLLVVPFVVVILEFFDLPSV